MSSFAIPLSSDKADAKFGKNGSLFYLNPPLTLPSRKHEFLLAGTTASIPLTYFVINLHNNVLQLSFDDEIVNITIRAGNNRSIEEVLEILNGELIDGFVAHSIEPAHRLTFTTETLGRAVTVGPLISCQRLLGVREGDISVDGTMITKYGVNLAGTSAIHIRSNLNTQNRDVVTKSPSNVIGKVAVCENFNVIERFISTTTFPIADRNIGMIAI